MKKILALLAVLALSVSMLAACSANNGSADNGAANNSNVATDTNTTPETPAPDTKDGLSSARDYLYTMYKDANPVTPADFIRVAVVRINGVTYEVKWSADSDTINFVYGEDKMVTIDVDEMNPEEVNYTLTATLSDANGNTETVSFSHSVPAAIIVDAGMSYEEIVEAAYALADGTSLDGTFRLFGTIVNIDTPWSEDYQNITVTIQVGELADKPIMCYRLKGEGAADLKVGDAITVEGVFKNYKGTIEFDAGCTLIGMGEHVDQTALLDAAYALADGIAMNAPCAMTGVISNIDTAWSDEYQNITVTMIVDGKTEQPIMCYRLKGEGAANLAVGDTITVAGTIKNYKGTIEFDAGCVLVKGALADAKLALAAYQLAEDIAMTSESTMTGVIASIDTEYSAEYENITVTIVPAGLEEYKIMCYRLKGEGAADLAVGDTITVTGTIKNYKGTIEYDAGCMLVDVVKG